MIFDCDGVLVDTEEVSCRCFADALRREGLDWSVAHTMQRLIGRSVGACVEIVERELMRPLPADFVERLQIDTLQAFRDTPIGAIPGASAALDALDDAGIPFCVASSGHVERMRLTLGITGLWQRFDGCVFSSSMVARGKPFPDLFLHAARTMGYPPQDCVVVEDAVPGVQAAVAAGMRVLAYGAASWADRGALHAAGGEVFDDMAQLSSLVGL